MPKIIRCDGVNIDDVRPIIVQRQPRGDDGASLTSRSQPDSVAQALGLEAVERQTHRLESQRQAEQLQGEMLREAQAVLEQARREAAAVLEQAREQAQEICAAARREGREEGTEKGLREIVSIKNDALEQISEALEDLHASRSRMIDELEAGVVDLVFDVVDKVLSVEMKRSTEWIVALVRNALSQLDGNESAVIRVGAQHYEKIAAIAAQLMAACGRDKRLQVVQETAFPPGACVIESEKGITDAGIETKMDKLKRAFKGNA